MIDYWLSSCITSNALTIPLAIFKYEQFGKDKCPREDLKNMSHETRWEF